MSGGTRSASLAGLRIDPDVLDRLPPLERERVAGELRAVEEAFKANPLIGYHPHGKQVVFHSPPFPPLRAFFGGNRSGKTTAAIVDTVIQAVDRDSVPDHLRPFKRWDAPLRCRVVTPDLTSTMDGVIHEKIREWCPKAQLKGGNFDRAFDKQQRMLHFKNGSWIQFNSSEQDREKLGGVALHRVVYDEEPRQEVRKECLTRLIDFDGEEIFALTPFSGMAWLFDEVYEPWERGLLDPHDGRVVVVDMDDNPHLSESGKKRALAQYSGAEREARKSGRFVSFSGLIYPMFSEERHVIPQLDRLPPGVEAFRSIDPGYRHMCAVGYYYIDADDELVKFDEIAMRQATVKDVCREIQRRDARWGVETEDGKRFPLRVNCTIIDPAARNKNNQTGRSDQAEFSDNGVPTVPGQNAVGAGINRVKERLDADKFKVTANCQVTIAQYRRYRWTKDDGRTEHEAREQPVKRDDHHCLVPGTLVLTERGDVPIERVRSDDRVLTRGGWRPVRVMALTNPDAEVQTLTLEDGRTLSGTGGHPIWVDGKGFTPLDAVRYNDILWVCPKSSFSTVSGSVVTPNPIDAQTGSTFLPASRIVSAGYADFMRKCGEALTETPRMVGMSTMSTGTRSTTISRTWRAFRRKLTRLSTSMKSGASECENRPSVSVRLQPHGTALQLGASGTAFTAALRGMAGNPSEHPASTAAEGMSRWTQGDSARIDARPRPDTPVALMTKPAFAPSVAKGSSATTTPGSALVRVRVAAVSKAGRSAVYNLTVDGVHEYFANGVLVHNCDADRYMVMYRPLAPSRDGERPSDTMKDRLLRHHLRRLRSPKRLPDSGFGAGIFQ